MRFWFLFLFLLLSLSMQGLGQEIPKEKYKLSRTEFLELYAVDDTTTNLINMYFHKRNASIIHFAILGSAGFLEGILISHLSVGRADPVSNIEEAASLTILVLGTTFILIPAIIQAPFGIAKLVKYKKKNLYLAIENYKSGKGISKSDKTKLQRFLSR